MIHCVRGEGPSWYGHAAPVVIVVAAAVEARFPPQAALLCYIQRLHPPQTKRSPIVNSRVLPATNQT